jgi:hypothetical protein
MLQFYRTTVYSSLCLDPLCSVYIISSKRRKRCWLRNVRKQSSKIFASNLKQSTLWFKESTQHKWDSIVMTTPTEPFNNMQAILAECSSAGIVITQQNAAIRFARLQPLSASYIPLMQFVLSTDNMTLGILFSQVCMIDSLLSKHSNAMNANTTRPSWGMRGNTRTPPDSKFRAPCTWCGIPGHYEERCFSKDLSNLTRFPPRNGWNTPDGKPPLSLIEKHRLLQP